MVSGSSEWTVFLHSGFNVLRKIICHITFTRKRQHKQTHKSIRMPDRRNHRWRAEKLSLRDMYTFLHECTISIYYFFIPSFLIHYTIIFFLSLHQHLPLPPQSQAGHVFISRNGFYFTWTSLRLQTQTPNQSVPSLLNHFYCCHPVMLYVCVCAYFSMDRRGREKGDFAPDVCVSI